MEKETEKSPSRIKWLSIAPYIISLSIAMTAAWYHAEERVANLEKDLQALMQRGDDRYADLKGDIKSVDKKVDVVSEKERNDAIAINGKVTKIDH